MFGYLQVVRPGMTEILKELRKELKVCQNTMRYFIVLKESCIRSVHVKAASLIKKEVGGRDCRRDILLNYRIQSKRVWRDLESSREVHGSVGAEWAARQLMLLT